MTLGRSAACFVLGLAIAAGLGASEPAPDAPARLACRLWAVTDAVLARHLDPPARQEMLAAALARVTAESHATGPTPEVNSAEQLTAWLRRSWPTPAGKLDEFEDSVLKAVFDRVPDSPRLVGADELRLLDTVRGNRYVGTGVQIRMSAQDALAKIVIPMAGGPARKAGARPGDLIESINGEDMRGKPLREFVARIGGAESTEVTMVVRQPGSDRTRTLRMTRGVVPFASAVGFRRAGEESWQFRLEPDLPAAYIRLNAVNASTAHELRKLDRALAADCARGLILDLRFADGEDVAHAAHVADGLLDGGLMWTVRGRGGRKTEYRADRDCLFRRRRMVALVNSETRGGAELVAAALQDNRRATLVGEPTTGSPPAERVPPPDRSAARPARRATDWAVRSLIELPDGLGTLSLQTGAAERASGRPWGVEPDAAVDAPPKLQSALQEWWRAQDSPEPDLNLKAPDDPQIVRALQILKDGGS
jgi:carboxyl-terminal processing protease